MAEKRELELSAFFESIDGAAALLDANMQYVIFNQYFISAHQLVFNTPPVVGQKMYSFLPTEEREKRYEIIAKVLNGSKEVIEVDYLIDAKRIYYRTSFSPVITNGKVTG